MWTCGYLLPPWLPMKRIAQKVLEGSMMFGGMSLRGAGGAESRCPPPGRQNRVSVLPPGPAWSDTLLVLCLPPLWGLFGVMIKRPCRCFGSGHPAQPENKAHMILSSRFYFQAE